METRFSVLFLVVIVLSMAIVLQIDSIESVDAAKAKGTKNTQYGVETKHKVCGDRLCTPEDFTPKGERKSLSTMSDSNITSHMAMAKMERLFELHRMQLLSGWDLMTDSEKSHMMKMFDKMYEKMQSMSFADHMKHMSQMMDGKHHDSMKGEHGMKDKHGMGGSCGDGEHSCSCGDGEHGSSCGDKGHE